MRHDPILIKHKAYNMEDNSAGAQQPQEGKTGTDDGAAGLGALQPEGGEEQAQVAAGEAGAADLVAPAQ